MLDANLVEKTHMNNRANLYHHLLIQVNMLRILNVTKKITMGLNIAKRKSEGEGASTCNNTKRVRRSVEVAKQLFPKHCMICKHSGAIKVKYKKQFPRLLTLQTSIDAMVRFANIRTCWKLFVMVNCYKGSLWFMTNATENIPTYQRIKQ